MNNSATLQRWQWADGPYPLIETPKHREGITGNSDPYMETASTMCVVHNALLRGLNGIYIQGPNIQPADLRDFIGYSLCWYSALHEHHTSEEEQFFPEIEEAVGEKGLLDRNVEEHKGKESAFDAVHLNSIIDSFAPALNHHLESELQSLLELRKYGDKLPITKLWDREGFRSVTSMTRFNAPPFFFLNVDTTDEDSLYKDWPPLPGPARWVITHVMTIPNRGYWKFASCDSNGKPKPLYAPGRVQIPSQ
uniref:Tat-linked quality control protein TatD n=1 Tax=Talaromyces marneffei PM1 TaxID=1077442 RepID=A0A093UP52_TALMA